MRDLAKLVPCDVADQLAAAVAVLGIRKGWDLAYALRDAIDE